MIKDIQATLNEFAWQDARIYFCRLKLSSLEGNRCVLTGTVLDGDALSAARNTLQTRFSDIDFDLENVKILGQASPRMLAVSTNATTVMNDTGWASETLSEVLNGWPLEILAEKGNWVFTRQADGYLGWVYREYLTETAVPTTTHMLHTPLSLLRAQPAEDAELLGRVFGGTAVSVTDQTEKWLKIDLAGDLSGWIPQTDAHPLNAFPTTVAAQRDNIITHAHQYIGIPYMWGGGTAHGLDCSGYAQLLYRLVGITIPRDADMQFDVGTPVEPPFKPGDLLYFGGEKGGHRSISHVGVSLGGWEMIHAARSRNGVYINNVQATPHLKNIYLGARTFLGGDE